MIDGLQIGSRRDRTKEDGFGLGGGAAWGKGGKGKWSGWGNGGGGGRRGDRGGSGDGWSLKFGYIGFIKIIGPESLFNI